MELIRVKTYEEMSRKAADIIENQVISHPDCVLGLATGSTPLGMYRELAADHHAGKVSFKDVTSVNLDEYRGLSREDEQSYYYFMHHNFFEKVDMKVSMDPVPFKVLPCDKYILKNNGNTYPFYYQTKVYVTLPKGIKKSQLNKRQAVLQNAVGPLRLKSKYYYKKQMVGWGMQYERNIVSDLLLTS